ncbi:MAG: two-component system response regulator [Anaerolineaceae bacterium]|nr:two-component system response regulator [Anaerolineaceae bacterium]
MSWKILVVDDDRGMRLLLRVSLERKGFQVTEAPDGRAAVDQVLVSPPDLVLMDVMMPRMDGLTACRIIRNTESVAYIPIIMLSALTADEDKQKGLDAGANLYLTKPVSPLTLVETVDQVLEDSNH